MNKYPDWFTETDHLKIDLENIIDKTNIELRTRIPGPLNEFSIKKVLKKIHYNFLQGRKHLLFTEFQEKYGTQQMSSNILIPYLQDNIVKDMIILCHPEDCTRLAKSCIKKAPTLQPQMIDSIISTADNKHWLEQRHHLIDEFSPKNLEKIIDISADRAKKCVYLLQERINNNKQVDIGDFLLNETQAQLQLALFGSSEEFVEETNKKIRTAFIGLGPKGYVRDFTLRLMDNIKNGTYKGPISKSFVNSPQKTETEMYGNLILFAFAGHDTTGHTLTWLIYELCNNLKIQTNLQKEVDKFWFEQQNRPIIIKDFERLPYMKKCIFETLRMWPAVADGTFRELEKDEYITGPNDNLVLIPKGTYIQISNWHRHRNSKLWGSDVNYFNPNRDFSEEEIWKKNFSAINPESERFSPFTYNPRSCLGKSFANIEMRLILLNLLKNYSFTSSDKIVHGNHGTLKPLFGLKVTCIPRYAKL